MLVRRYVSRRAQLLREPLTRRYGIRLASNGRPKKATSTTNAAVKSSRYQAPPKRPPPRTTPQGTTPSPPPPPSNAPFSFPSKLAAGVLGGIAVLAGFYTFSVVKGLSVSASQSRGLEIDPDAPSVKIYDHIAPYFDAQVNSNEFWLGISRLRKQIVGQAAGDVLEVGVGTGRNHGYYNLKECRSITFLDASENMVAIASAKWNQRRILPEWKETAPDGTRRVNFRIAGAQDTVFPPSLAEQEDQRGFTTIVSTFTLCSMPRPAGALAHLCSLLSRNSAEQPRVLLLEHGKSEYEWINNLLDNSAPAHANQYGCWWNRDIGAIAAEAAGNAGFKVASVKRKHFGTTWIIELRPDPEAKVRKSVTNAASIAAPEEIVRHQNTAVVGISDKKWWQVW